MANTDVTLVHSDGTYVPSIPSIPVVSGDTVSFSTDDGSSALAWFSPAALSVLSPSPSNPSTVGANAKMVYKFTSSDAGAYTVVFAADASSAPSRYPAGSSHNLRLEFADPDAPPFDNSMNTGH